jgi:hypothetical protein
MFRSPAGIKLSQPGQAATSRRTSGKAAPGCAGVLNSGASRSWSYGRDSTSSSRSIAEKSCAADRSKDLLAEHRLPARRDGEAARGRDSQRVHRLADDVLAQHRAERRASIAPV